MHLLINFIIIPVSYNCDTFWMYVYRRYQMFYSHMLHVFFSDGQCDYEAGEAA